MGKSGCPTCAGRPTVLWNWENVAIVGVGPVPAGAAFGFCFCDFLLRILKTHSKSKKKNNCLYSLLTWGTRHVSHSKYSRAVTLKAELCLLHKSLIYTG